MVTGHAEGYAAGIAAIAAAEGQLDRVSDELFRIARAVDGSGELRETLSDPRLPADRKAAVVEDLLGGKASPLSISIVDFVVSAGRVRELSSIADVLAERAELDMELENYPEALTSLQKVIDHGREETAALAQFTTGDVYRLMDEPDKAIIEYLKVPYLYPGLTGLELEARMQAASIYLKKGNKKEAAKLLKIITDHPEAGEFKEKAEELLNEIGG